MIGLILYDYFKCFYFVSKNNVVFVVVAYSTETRPNIIFILADDLGEHIFVFPNLYSAEYLYINNADQNVFFSI